MYFSSLVFISWGINLRTVKCSTYSFRLILPEQFPVILLEVHHNFSTTVVAFAAVGQHVPVSVSVPFFRGLVVVVGGGEIGFLSSVLSFSFYTINLVVLGAYQCVHMFIDSVQQRNKQNLLCYGVHLLGLVSSPLFVDTDSVVHSFSVRLGKVT